MNKKILYILLIPLILFATGCSIRQVDKDDYDYLIDNILLKNKKVKVSSYGGYSLYIPNGLKTIEKDETNLYLKDKYNNKYFVYVDTISYYHKVDNTYKVDNSSYYARKIVSKDKKKSGYLQIDEINDKYFVQAVYNYVKIEVYTEKHSLSDTIINVCDILSSIKYNNKILKSTIGENVLNYKEEKFNIFSTKKVTSNYLDYVEKYDGLSVSEVKTTDNDEDIIDIEIDED